VLTDMYLGVKPMATGRIGVLDPIPPSTLAVVPTDLDVVLTSSRETMAELRADLCQPRQEVRETTPIKQRGNLAYSQIWRVKDGDDFTQVPNRVRLTLENHFAERPFPGASPVSRGLGCQPSSETSAAPFYLLP
jgi:hypothetical protein